MEVVLYDYWRSTAAMRVRIALGLAGIEFESVRIDLLSGANRSPEHVARNPQGLVPVLETDGLVLTQSLAIMEYLDETGRIRLLPTDPAGRARVRAISAAIAMEIHAVCNLSVAAWVAEESGGRIPMQKWMDNFVSRGIEAVERHLERSETGRYCHGDRVTMADVCLYAQLYNVERWNVSLDSAPNVRRIGGALGEIEAFAAARPERHRTAEDMR